MRKTFPKTLPGTRHRMLGVTMSALALLTLWSCAAAQPVAPAASNPTPAVPAEADAAPVAPAPAFVGLWYVSGVFPTAAARASVADPHLGAALVIDGAEVSDINGQRCVTPTFQADKADAQSLGQALGAPAVPAGRWDRLQVSCDGKAFATYILVPAKSGLGMAATAPKHALLQQRPEALYLLEQAEEILYRTPGELLKQPVAVTGEVAPKLEAALPEPAPAEKAGKAETAPIIKPVELAPKTAPMPVPEGPVAAQPEPAAKMATPHVTATGGAKIPAPGTAIHLASYKGESAAKRGWKILLGDYDELDPLSPLYVAVDVPGKGAIIRLYATGEDKAGLSKICTALKAKKVYCTLNP